jgi:hypothetical protein
MICLFPFAVLLSKKINKYNIKRSALGNGNYSIFYFHLGCFYGINFPAKKNSELKKKEEMVHNMIHNES